MHRSCPSVLATLLLLGGCGSCPPAPEMKRLPGETLATPEAALAYFRAALRSTAPSAAYHQYLCFSEGLKQEFKEREKQEFSLGNYVYVRDDVRDYIQKRAGPLDRIEIGEPRYLRESPHLAEVDLSAGGQKATIQMVQETTFFVQWKNPQWETVDGTLPFGAAPGKLSAGELILRLPLATAPRTATAADIYQVSYERAWKILGLKDSNLAADIRQFLRKREAERTAEKPKT